MTTQQHPTSRRHQTINPQRNLPIGILGGLAICTLIYVVVGAVITGMVPYTELGVADPLARLVGTVTEYNRLTRDQNASQSLGPSQALSHLYAHMQHKYGLDVIEPFIATVTVFPPGSFVELSDNSIGLVMKSNVKERLRPLVMLYEREATHGQASMIDLSRERSLTILKSLDRKLVPARIQESLNPGKFNGYVMTSASA